MRDAELLEAGDELSGRYILRGRLSPAEPISFVADDALLNRKVTMTFLNLDSDYAELIYGSERGPGISGLRHPALARLFDVGHEPGVRESFIVTDYVGGLPLSELIGETSMVSENLSSYVHDQLADLVSYLKAHGLAHRDLSPHNIRVVLPAQHPGTISTEHPLLRVGLIGLHPGPDEPAPGVQT